MGMIGVDGIEVLESFRPETVFSLDDLEMKDLTVRAKNTNGLYHQYFQGLLGFAQTCELATGIFSGQDLDAQKNIEPRQDLYNGLSDAIINSLVVGIDQSLNLGTIYQLASQKYPDSFATKEDYLYALQLALFGKFDEKSLQYVPDPDISTNPSIDWHCRVVGDYASCLKSLIDVFGTDTVRSVVTPGLYEVSQKRESSDSVKSR